MEETAVPPHQQEPSWNEDQGCYTATFETNLLQKDGGEDGSSTTPQHPRKKLFRKRRNSAGAAASLDLSRDSIVRIDFEETTTPTTTLTSLGTSSREQFTDAVSEGSLRRILSTGDLPNHPSPLVATDDAGLDPTKLILTRTNSLSPCSLAAILTWSNTSSGNKQLNDSNATDDDAISLSSSTYFEPDDFDPSRWRSILNDPPAFGFAVVALATAVTHPLLFMAGALTAWGSVTAAHRGYNYWNSTTPAAAPSSSTSKPLDCFKEVFCIDPSIHVRPEESAVIEEGKDEEDGTVQPLKNKNESPITAKLSDTDATTLEPSSNATKRGDDNIMITNKPEINRASPPVEKKRRKLQPEKRKEWLDLHYPTLKNNVVKQSGPLVGLNAVDFFHVFFDDNAVYSFKVFQEKRKDIDIVYGNWKELPKNIGSVSMMPDRQESSAITLRPLFPQETEYRTFQGRTLSFKAKTNSLFGPPYATTVKTQRILIVDKRLAILESMTNLSDIPFSDRFFVMERWIVTAEKVNGRYVAHVSASCEVIFHQSCPFENQIKSKSISTIADICNSWCSMATEALKLTERAKLNRLQRSGLDDDDDDDDTAHYEDDTDDNDVDHHPLEKGHAEGLEVVVRQLGDDDPVEGQPQHHIFMLAAPSRTQQVMRPTRPIASVRRSLSQLKRRRASLASSTNVEEQSAASTKNSI